MSVSSSTSRIVYAGNNSLVTAYAVPFYFEENAHLNAIAKTAAGVETVVTLTNHTGAGNENGGTVRTAVAVPATSTLTIFREVPFTQNTSYEENDAFPAASHERALDKLTTITQQIERRITNCIRGTEATPLAPIPSPTGTQQFVLSAASNQPPSWQELPVLAAGPVVATGSTQARFISDRFADVVNVKDFGAVGDGVADDTAAIQAAVNTGRVVHFSAGTYLISSAIGITVNNTGIRGDGYGTLIKTTSATADVFLIGDGVNPIRGLIFSEFAIWSSVTKSAGIAFNCRYVTNSTWFNVACGSINYYVAGANTHKLYDGYFFNRFGQCTIVGGEIVVSNDGIKARGNSDQSFGAELSVYGGVRIYKANSKAVYLSGACGGVYLERVDISECYRGLYCDSVLAGVTNREVFLGDGCTFDTCPGWGINLEANSVALLEVTGAWVSACGSVATGEGGIRIAPSAGISARWSNIRVNYCYYDGIQISDGAHVFSGGFVRNCGTSAPGGNGILLAGISQATITGMEIHDNGNATRGYGIQIEASVTNYNIQSNALFGNGQKAIYQPSGPSLSRMIRDNRGWVTENSGVVQLPNGSTSVVVNHGLSDVPTLVQVTAAGDQDAGAYAFAAPGSFTATQFTISYSTTATAQRDFSWRATRGQA